MEEPKEKKNYYKINYGLIVLFFILKSIDVLFTWYIITNYGIEVEANPIVRLFFGRYGIDIFIFYIPILGLLIYNYYYRENLYLMKAEFYAVSVFLIILYIIVFNNLFIVLLAQ